MSRRVWARARRSAAALAIAASLMATDARADPYAERFARAAAALRAARGQARGAGELLDLLDAARGVPVDRLRAVLAELLAARALHPLVAARVELELAQLEEDLGRAELAAARYRALGFAEAAHVLGPLDAVGGDAIVRSPDPGLVPDEGALWPDPGLRLPGKLAGQEIGWRALAGLSRRGALVLDAALRPDTEALAYVAVELRSARGRTVALRLGSPGGVKVWLDGAPVFERAVTRAAQPDQEAVPLWLSAGRHRLLIKTGIEQGAWRLFLRVTELDGAPARGVEVSPPGAGADRRPGPRQRRAAAAARVAHVEATLRAAVLDRDPARAALARLDLARWLLLVQSGDRHDDEVEALLAQAAEALAASAHPERGLDAWLWLGRVARDDNRRRAALESARARARTPGELCLIASELGELSARQDRGEEAEALFRLALARAEASSQGCWPAALGLAGLEQAAGLPLAALARLAAEQQRAGDLEALARARLSALESLGRKGEAEALAGALLVQRGTDVGLLERLIAARRARGELAEAAALQERVLELRPELVYPRLALAELHEALGQGALARAVLEAGLAQLPDEPALHRALGELCERTGDRRGALRAYARALALRPQSPELRRVLARVRAEVEGRDAEADGEELARAYALDGEALARAALDRSAGPTPARGEPAEILAERRIVRVHDNGLSDVFVQRLIHVRTDAAAREHQEFLVRYVPGLQEVDVLVARVFRRAAGGALEVTSATGRDDRDLSEPWYGLYYDTRADVVTWDDLRAGDVAELQYTLSDVAARNELADHFGELRFVADTVPTRLWEYVVRIPARRPLHVAVVAPPVGPAPAVVHTTRAQGAEVEHRFVARDVPRLQLEPMMPGWTEVAAHVHVSTFASWEELGRFYGKLVADALRPDEAVRRVAAELREGATSELERVRRAHGFVLDATRYVGLEFGIHGYKPYPVGQVLARRFGDCKDKASLIVALLGELGVPAELVLLRTRRGGRVGPMPASLAVFDHAVVYVPSLDLYLDGTAEFSGLSELPFADQAATALHVRRDGAVRLVETPVLPASANRATRTWRAAVRPDGGAEVIEEVEITGQAAPDWRRFYQVESERAERFAKAWRERFAGAQVLELEMPGITERNQPVRTRARLAVPALATAREGSLHLPVAARPVEYLRAYARGSEREHVLELSFPWRHHERLTFVLPAALRATRLPPPARAATDFAEFRFDVTTSADGAVVEVESWLEVREHRVAPHDYPGWRAFLAAVERSLTSTIALSPADGEQGAAR